MHPNPQVASRTLYALPAIKRCIHNLQQCCTQRCDSGSSASWGRARLVATKLMRFLMFVAAALAPSYGYFLPSGRLPSQQTIRPPLRIDYGTTRNHSLIWPLRSPGPQCCLVAFAAVGTPLTAAQLAITQFAHFMVFPICLSTLFVACETRRHVLQERLRAHFLIVISNVCQQVASAAEIGHHHFVGNWELHVGNSAMIMFATELFL